MWPLKRPMAVAVLRQQVTRIGKLRLLARQLLRQPRLGIGRRGMRHSACPPRQAPPQSQANIRSRTIRKNLTIDAAIGCSLRCRPPLLNHGSKLLGHVFPLPYAIQLHAHVRRGGNVECQPFHWDFRRRQGLGNNFLDGNRWRGRRTSGGGLLRLVAVNKGIELFGSRTTRVAKRYCLTCHQVAP